ncbi:hypothetical protein LTR35_000627 [Friedmanniomyces endolithicus]|uniref:Uncharacterized protein n=1 Tax=Friedmanniomyces endolithicus TaxID=329885 RepID=A0AAN6J4D9_9PEZI|nr:hypothetical protein LTS00_013935 [Friedmanniomyces endolithicus]KAK0292596.1 hypothetical protein LTR35_000627 [Friedmanniomyces endolithicus]KAK0303837.1 hypothetical protein LTR82_017444 [Friedmanniomyces endolithicus]KAK1007665.1 hypothetical protein LTR54_006391 [Friedmanniomyces endolithicus]
MVNRITNFFKPFILPKSRVPDNDEEEDEIVVGQGASSIRVPAFPATQLKSTNGAEPSRGSSASSTPPERTTRGTPQKRSRPSSQEGTTDNDDLCHSTPTPSKQRVMTAVSIPSPKRQISPPVKVERAAVPSPRGTTSFNSTSTLSSVPMSSQSSSKRIVRNGLQAVTNSDSASADDSDDDLADIETFIPRKKLKITPSPPKHHKRKVPLQDTVKSTRQSARLSDHSSRSRSHTPYLPPSPPRTEYKHSLLKMVKANQKQEKQKRRVAEIESQVADAERSRKEQEVLEKAELDPQAMAAEIAENSEDEERLGTAIERTEALQEEVTYNFFLQKPVRATKQSFPVEEFGQQPFAAVMKDDQAREQACLTGFTADLAAEGLLPHAAICWFVQQMVHEPREELCEAYVEIVRLATTDQDALRDACHPSLRVLYTTVGQGVPERSTNTQKLPRLDEGTLSASSLQQPKDVFTCACNQGEADGCTVACGSCKTQHANCYYQQYDGQDLSKTLSNESVGVNPRTLDGHAARKHSSPGLADQSPNKGASTKLSTIAPGLRHVVRAMQYMIAGTSVQSIGQAVVDLAYANIDDYVRKDIDIQRTIQDSIEGLLEDLVPIKLDSIYDYVKNRLFPPSQRPNILLCRLVASLPASSINAHYLRRRLALYCVTESSSNTPLTSPTWFRTLTKRLRTAPEYTISNSTNYALLHALISVLDLALDAGFSDFCFLNPTTTPPILPSVTEPHRRSHPLFAFHNTSAASTKLPEEERAFNSHVDALVAQLKFMASRVRNSGAAHMTRMEAKEALERVIVRAEWGVRTRGKGRREVFGGGGGGEEVCGRGKGVRFSKGLVEKIPVEGVREAKAEAQAGEEGDVSEELPGLESLAGSVTDANVVSRVEHTVCAEVAGTSLRLEVSLVATQNANSTPNLLPAPVVERKDAASSSRPDRLDVPVGLTGHVTGVDEPGTVIEADAEMRGEESGKRDADTVAGAEAGDSLVTGAEPSESVNDAMSDTLGTAVGLPNKPGKHSVCEGGSAASAALEGPVALTEKCTFV